MKFQKNKYIYITTSTLITEHKFCQSNGVKKQAFNQRNMISSHFVDTIIGFIKYELPEKILCNKKYKENAISPTKPIIHKII